MRKGLLGCVLGVLLAGCQSSKIPEGLQVAPVEGYCPSAASLFVYRGPRPSNGARFWLCVDTKARRVSPAWGKLDDLRAQEGNRGRLFYPLDYAMTSFDGTSASVFVGAHDLDEIVRTLRETMRDEPLAGIEQQEVDERILWHVVSEGRQAYFASEKDELFYWGSKSWQVPELAEVCKKAKYREPYPEESMHLEIAHLGAWLSTYQKRATMALMKGGPNQIDGLDLLTLGKTLFTAKMGADGIPVCDLTVDLPSARAAGALARELDKRLKAVVATLTPEVVAASLKARVQSGMTIAAEEATVHVQVKMFGLGEPYWAGFGCLAVLAEVAQVGLPYEVDPR